MIQISDRIVSYFGRLAEEDYKALLILSRYLTEEKEVSFEKLICFFESEAEMLKRIFRLHDLGLIDGQVDMATGVLTLVDLLDKSRSLKVVYGNPQKTQISVGGTSSVEPFGEFNQVPPSTSMGGTTLMSKMSNNGDQPDRNPSDPQSLVDSLAKAITDRDRAYSGAAIRIVEYFFVKRKNLDPRIVIDNRERKKNLAMAKQLLTKYPHIDIDTWLRAIDYFFNNPFWAPSFTQLLLLDKKLQEFLVKDSKKPRSPKIKVIT